MSAKLRSRTIVWPSRRSTSWAKLSASPSSAVLIAWGLRLDRAGQRLALDLAGVGTRQALDFEQPDGAARIHAECDGLRRDRVDQPCVRHRGRRRHDQSDPVAAHRIGAPQQSELARILAGLGKAVADGGFQQIGGQFDPAAIDHVVGPALIIELPMLDPAEVRCFEPVAGTQRMPVVAIQYAQRDMRAAYCDPAVRVDPHLGRARRFADGAQGFHRRAVDPLQGRARRLGQAVMLDDAGVGQSRAQRRFLVCRHILAPDLDPADVQQRVAEPVETRQEDAPQARHRRDGVDLARLQHPPDLGQIETCGRDIGSPAGIQRDAAAPVAERVIDRDADIFADPASISIACVMRTTTSWRLPWLSSTALGLPCVPDVKEICAGSSPPRERNGRSIQPVPGAGCWISVVNVRSRRFWSCALPSGTETSPSSRLSSIWRT
jgi:hypothetical protein